MLSVSHHLEFYLISSPALSRFISCKWSLMSSSVGAVNVSWRYSNSSDSSLRLNDALPSLNKCMSYFLRRGVELEIGLED